MIPTAPGRAIVLGSDSPIGLTVIRELGRRGVQVQAVGRAADAIGGASRFASAHHVRPGGPLADWLPAMIRRTRADALLAVSEADLLDLSLLPAVMDGCRILTPRAAPLALVLDKSATLARAATLGIDVPASWQPVAGQDFAECAARLTYPVVLKWADPPAVLGLLADHALPFVKAGYADRPAALLDALAATDAIGRWPLVQRWVEGIGLGQMLHLDEGVATLAFQHERIHEWPPAGGISTLCRAVPLDRHAAAMTRSKALLAAIGWQGPAMVEYRHDPVSGRYWLMEINGRFWGSLPLASACGAHFAWESYRRAVLGDRTPAPAPRGDLVARYMVPETRRLIRLFAQARRVDPVFRPTPWRDTVDYLARFFDPATRYYVFSPADPAPLLCDLRNMLGQVFGAPGRASRSASVATARSIRVRHVSR